MIKQSVRFVVSSAVVIAALTSASSASAHDETWFYAPRPLVQNDSLEFPADQVAASVETTSNTATVRTTLLTDANYLYSIDLAANCSDGEPVSNNILPISESSGDSISCAEGATIVEAYAAIVVYGIGGHEEQEGGEEEEGEEG